MATEMKAMYNTKTFTEIYDDVNDFLDDYSNIGIPTTISNTNATTLFYLLYSMYGNSPIANFDITQFKYKLFSIVFMYGPTWEKRLDIQEKLRELEDDDIIIGSKIIYNHAYNPSNEPSTDSLEALEYIDNQNITNQQKSKMDAYTQLWNLLETDVTRDFINKFKICFKQFALPRMYIYESED